VSDVTDTDSMFRELLEAQAEAIVIIDGAGEIMIVNARAEEMFGYTREELLGQRVELLIPAAARGRHSAHRQGYVANPHTRRWAEDWTSARGTGTDRSSRRRCRSPP
jgi:PAS domain S-box-containing protein